MKYTRNSHQSSLYSRSELLSNTDSTMVIKVEVRARVCGFKPRQCHFELGPLLTDQLAVLPEAEQENGFDSAGS